MDRLGLGQGFGIYWLCLGIGLIGLEIGLFRAVVREFVGGMGGVGRMGAVLVVVLAVICSEYCSLRPVCIPNSYHNFIVFLQIFYDTFTPFLSINQAPEFPTCTQTLSNHSKSSHQFHHITHH